MHSVSKNTVCLEICESGSCPFIEHKLKAAFLYSLAFIYFVVFRSFAAQIL